MAAHRARPPVCDLPLLRRRLPHRPPTSPHRYVLTRSRVTSLPAELALIEEFLPPSMQVRGSDPPVCVEAQAALHCCTPPTSHTGMCTHVHAYTPRPQQGIHTKACSHTCESARHLHLLVSPCVHVHVCVSACARILRIAAWSAWLRSRLAAVCEPRRSGQPHLGFRPPPARCTPACAHGRGGWRGIIMRTV